jgi:hypothetical protein
VEIHELVTLLLKTLMQENNCSQSSLSEDTHYNILLIVIFIMKCIPSAWLGI